MSTISISNHTFEAGASILHPKNFHALNYTELLSLKINDPKTSSFSLGIWDGSKFTFKTLSSDSESPLVQKALNFANSVLMFMRYKFSLLKMTRFVEETVNRFLKYYESFETRPVFESVEDMLKWAGLYDLTGIELQDALIDAGLSPLLIQELVTIITRINYGQSVSMSGLAGAVSLAGSGGGLWSVKGGNWQMAEGLIKRSNVELHLREEIDSISNVEDCYVLNSTKGNSYMCDVAVVASPLDELDIQFTPSISIPMRSLQHTYTTFIRGVLNPAYFGLKRVSDIPELVGTLEDPDIPFSCIAVLKKHDEQDRTFKMFSRKPMTDSLLDDIFSTRRETIRIDWPAYPRYKAPEVFAPFILDGKHLYYANAFESAASTMETSAVSGENMARLILSRLSDNVFLSSSQLKCHNCDEEPLHVDL